MSALEPLRTIIRFRVDDQRVGTEGLWAEQVLEDPGKAREREPETLLFRLLNVPFYALGVALHEVVVARWSAELDAPEFVRIFSRARNSAYRIVVRAEAESDDVDRAWGQLEALGCGCEVGTSPTVWAVHAPSGIDRTALDSVLDGGIRDGICWVEEGHVDRSDM